MAAAFGGSSGAALGSEARSIYELFNSNAALLAGGSAGNSSQPRAYLNYILFDQDFNYVDAGFDQVSAAAQNGHEKLSLPTLNITEGGYLYVYVSNESNTNFDVFFDDLRITHTKGTILQEDHYYPFGLQINALSIQAPLSKPNRFLYNGGVELNTDFDFGIYETFFRQYDPVLGRFVEIDPKADLFQAFSPYNFAFNDPIYWNDPAGDCPSCEQDPEKADDLYAVGAFVTNTNGSWEYLGGGKWKDVSGNPSANSNNQSGYYYNQADFDMRMILLSLSSRNPVRKELERREASGNYQPITAQNYLNNIDERSARLGTFALYATGSLYPGSNGRLPGVRGTTVTARFTGSRYSRHTVSLKYNDPQPNGTTESITIKGGKVFLNGRAVSTGRFDFVITTRGELRIGSGHYHLSGGAKSVHMAGRLKIWQGKVKFLSGNSGHYRPTPAQTQIGKESLNMIVNGSGN